MAIENHGAIYRMGFTMKDCQEIGESLIMTGKIEKASEFFRATGMTPEASAQYVQKRVQELQELAEQSAKRKEENENTGQG